jgi:hypothetical protein
MSQSQGKERRRSRKQCKDWCNPLGPSLQIYRVRPQHSRWAWGLFLCFYGSSLLGLFISLSGLHLLAIEV